MPCKDKLRGPRESRGQRESGLPRVSVIERAYNSERYIGKALDSVLAQSYAGPVDIIVPYDRGTADGTARVLGAYGDVRSPTGA